MVTEVAESTLSIDKLAKATWKFGLTFGKPVTETFAFSTDGIVRGYSNANEATWRLNQGKLEIFRLDGRLMWVSKHVQVISGLMHIIVQHAGTVATEFVLVENVAQPKELSESAQMINTADFLFPKDLQVTPTNIKNILLIGSCLTALYHEQFQRQIPDVAFDYISFNYAGMLPAQPPKEVERYDLQYVQIPLRSVITDRIVWGSRLDDPAFVKKLLDDGYDVIDAMLSSALSYNKSHGILTLVSNFFVPQMTAPSSLASRNTTSDLPLIVWKLNEYLAKAILSYRNVFLADVNALADSIGKRYILDDLVYFYSHGAPFFHEWADLDHSLRIEPIPHVSQVYETKRSEFLSAVFDQIVASYRTVHQVDQVKVVIFDLDNTLWRGQLAEHYRSDQERFPKTDGWPIGIWEAIHHLRARGILVAICSKNDLEVVKVNWGKVVQPAFLSLDDFVSVKINWNPKAESIIEICRELNVKPKSVVFVDDNAAEREAVIAAIPTIRAIGANPYLTRRILLWSSETQVSYLTDESAGREKMVRSQLIREEERTVLTRDDFLRTLGCRVSFCLVTDSQQKECARALELVNKTNQFNTTGKRWSYGEVNEFLKAGGRIIAFRVKDKFADYGLVGAVFVDKRAITQFVMSCRVMGMEIEQFAVSHVTGLIRSDPTAANVVALMTVTADNGPCRDVFLRSGFKQVNADEFLLAADKPAVVPAHIKDHSWEC